MLVPEAVARSLADNGVSHLFGLLGEGNLYIGVAVRDLTVTRFVPAAHESTAVMMACGYAEATGRLGVATVTHGPGLTNALTALTHAARAEVPLLLVCGDTPVRERQHLQRIDSRAIVAPTGAGFVRVRTPDTVFEDFASAVRTAYLNRGPVVLDVPVDLQWETVAAQSLPSVPAPPEVGIDPVSLDAALGLVASAQRPLVLAGRGALDAGDELGALADRIGAPAATTLLAKGLFAGHPNDIGIFGTLASDPATAIIAEADVVIAFGAGLNRYTTMGGSLLAGKRVVQCDRRPGSIGRWEAVDVGIVGDAALVASAMDTALADVGIESSDFANERRMAPVRAHDPRQGFDDLSTARTVDPRTAMVRLDAVLPDPHLLVTDAGRFVDHAFGYFTPSHPGGLVHTLAFGSIGLGMAAAVGAAHGCDDRPVVALVGDGAFMMSGLAEFHLAVRDGLDVITIVFNDHAYGAEHTHLYDHGMDTGIIEFDWPSFADLATSVGGSATTVRNPDDLEAAAELVKRRQGPVLIELVIDPVVLSRDP